jgi:hypothetical protein
MRVEKREQRTPHRNGGDFLFTRLVFCGNCGSPMHGCTNRQKDKDKTGRLRSDKIRTYRRYICGRYNAHGRLGGCVCNTIPERQLLHAVVGRFGAIFGDEGNLAQLRAEIGRQLEARRQADPRRVQALREKIATLRGQIDRGAERLLTSPPDLTEVLSDKLRDWQEQRRQAQADLEALEKASEAAGNAEVQIERAMACLRELPERVADADRSKLRGVIRQMVSRIECHFEQVPYGRRTQSRLTQGRIHLRPDLVLSRDVLSGSPLTTVTPARARPEARRVATRRP